MNLEDAAGLFENVRWNGTTRFSARCPAHEDRRSSLSVREGHTNIMVKCFAGCTFFEVAAAVGVRPLEFKIGGGTGGVAVSAPTARSRLRRLLRRPDLETLRDVASAALQPTLAQLDRAAERYPTFIELPYEEAMTMDVVVMVGPVFEWLWDGIETPWGEGRYYPRYDTRNWYEARDRARKEMAQTWRQQ